MINILVKRITEILAEKGWSKKYFADLVETNTEGKVSADTVMNVCNGRTADPRASTLLAISKTLHTSINCLLGECPHTPAEKSILRNYRECGQHGKSIIELIARYEAGAVKNERNSLKKHKIPCLIPHGDIHKGIIYDTCETAEIETSVNEAYVSIKMVNNDLAPVYCKGDIILLENRFPNHGEYGAFFYNGRAYIRKFLEEDGRYRLQCLHKHGEDLVFKRMDEVDYIGACIEAVRT